MAGNAGRCRRAGGLQLQANGDGLRTITDAAVRHDAGDASYFQPFSQLVTQHGNIVAATAVNDQHATFRRLMAKRGG